MQLLRTFADNLLQRHLIIGRVVGTHRRLLCCSDTAGGGGSLVTNGYKWKSLMALNEWWKSGTSMISSVGGGGGAGSSVVTLWSSRPASNWSPSHDIHRTVHMSTSPVAPLLHHSGADICRRVSSSAGHYHRSIRALSQSAMSDEAAKAQTAGPEKETIFGKILKGELPTKFIYEDDKCVAFNDINPSAPTHFLVIPRKPITQLATAKEEDEQILGHLMIVAAKVAKQQGLDQGYRVVINNGPHGCQSVYHIHLHVIGGRQLTWPAG